MMKMAEIEESKIYCDLVVKGMLEIKASDIAVLGLRKVRNAVADYFVICSCNSGTQIDATSDAIEQEVYKITGCHPWKREGKEGKEWVLIDYGNVVAHIFKKDRREFYALEKMWGDADIVSHLNANE